MKKKALTLGVFALVGCTSEKPAIQNTGPAKPASSAHDDGAYADSVLGTSRGDAILVTAKGDTVQLLGGTFFESDTKSQYAVDEYRINGTHFLRVVRMLGHRPDGMPIETTAARIQLPAMDSTEELLLTGLCRVNGKSDPRIAAIAFVPDDSTYAPARHAWRFDPTTEKLTELPVRGITCTHIVGED